MKNPQNLIPNSERTAEERESIARAGGIASGKARREKKAMREWAEVFGEMNMEVPLPSGRKKKTTMDGAVIFAQYQKAIKKGDTTAARFLAALKGELEEAAVIDNGQKVVIVRSQDEKDKIDNIGDLDI